MQTRREFVGKLGGALAVVSSPALMAGCAGGLSSYRGEMANGFIKISKADNAQLLTKGGLLMVRAQDLPIQIAVRNIGEQGVTAFSTVCTHAGCEVRPMPDGFECPCHGSAFELDGEVAEGPASDPLQRFEVIENENEFLIKVK